MISKGVIINNQRRQIIFGLAGMLASSHSTLNASDQALQPAASAYEPTGEIYWSGQYFLWVGGFKKKFALIKQSFGVPPSIVSFLAGRPSCKTFEDQLLLSGDANTILALDLNDVQLKLRLLEGAEKPFNTCRSSLAMRREQLEQAGLANITNLGPMGRKPGSKITGSTSLPFLACRPTQTDVTELIYSNLENKVQLKSIDWPLARDNPVIQPDPINGGWIAYPSFIFKRKIALQKVTKGIPVTHISEQFEVTRSFVPWDDWSLTGAYRIYVSKKGLVCAVGPRWSRKNRYKPGIYMDTGKNWALRFPGDVDIGSVTVGARDSSLAWVEQVSLKHSSADYGSRRSIIRIERL